MNKFDSVLKKISEQVPTMQQTQQPAAGATGQTQQPKPATPGTQQNIDPKIVQELIAAKNEQQVQIALQKLQALQQAQQQKPATSTSTVQQPAV